MEEQDFLEVLLMEQEERYIALRNDAAAKAEEEASKATFEALPRLWQERPCPTLRCQAVPLLAELAAGSAGKHLRS